MPAEVTYVRHAMADTTAADPAAWHLGPTGREAAVDLAHRLQVRAPVAAVVTSPEPKAVESAGPIADLAGLDVAVDHRLREVRRTWVGPGYRAVAHRYLRGDVPADWEPHVEVAARIQGVVDDAAPDGSTVIVTHGLALSLHLAARLGPGFDAESFWSRLAFPDAWTLDDDETLRRPYGVDQEMRGSGG